MILVIGGTGLIGSHLLYQLLHANEPVRVLKRKGSNPENLKKIFSYYSDNADALFAKIEWAEGDISDVCSLWDAMESIKDVYNCSGMVAIGGKNVEVMMHNNVKGTANIVDAALRGNIRKLCHVSSVAALGIDEKREIAEQSEWNERSEFSSYAKSKYLSENEVWRGVQEGLKAVIVNPSYVIGPGNWLRSKKDIFLTAQKGIAWYTGGGTGFVDARNVADCMIQLINSDVANERFIISSENISYKKFLELIHGSIRQSAPKKKAGKTILALAQKLDSLRSFITGKPTLLTKEIARYSNLTLNFDNRKIKEALGYSFIPVEQSIKDTAAHFSNRKNHSEK